MLKPLSITEISKYITQIFDMEEMLQGVKIYGEVSGCSFVRGNLYFSLKDENSIISCIMFGVAGNTLKDGDAILATGSLKYYAKGGKLNFYVTAVDQLMKGEGDNPTVGLVICKSTDKTVVEWSLKDICKPLGVATYQLEEVVERTVREIEAQTQIQEQKTN